MDTEKQRQRRRDDARLTESGNARNEQLNTRGAKADSREFPTIMSRYVRRYTECCKYS